MTLSSDPSAIDPLVAVIRHEINRVLERLGVTGLVTPSAWMDGLEALIRKGLLSENLYSREEELLEERSVFDMDFADALLTVRVDSVLKDVQRTLSSVVPDMGDQMDAPFVIARGDGVLGPEKSIGGAAPTLLARMAQNNVGQTFGAQGELSGLGDTILLTNLGGVKELQSFALVEKTSVALITPEESCADEAAAGKAIEMSKALELLEQVVIAAAPEAKRKALQRVCRGEDLVGEILGAKYRVDARLGRGSFGTVYRARDLILGAQVAVKVLNRSIAGKQDAFDDFLGEAQKLTTLDHENIVRWITFDRTDDGLHYFVMEYLDGQELNKVTEAHGLLEPKLAGQILRQTLLALEKAHDETREGGSLLHLDLKPQNIFINGALTPQRVRTKVIDFGISQHVKQVDFQTIALDEFDLSEGGHLDGANGRQSKSEASTIVRSTAGLHTSQGNHKVVRAQGGTPLFASPEQCRHLRGDPDIEPLDGRSDLYSLGVVAFQMLTGDMPFVHPKNTSDAFRQHLEVAPRKVRDVNPKVPLRLAAFVDRCLIKKPTERWQSATQARQALKKAMEPLVSKQFVATLIVLLMSAVAIGYFGLTKTVIRPPASLQLLNAQGERLGNNDVVRVDLEMPSIELGTAGSRQIFAVSEAVPEGELTINLGDSTGTTVKTIKARGLARNRIELSAVGNQVDLKSAQSQKIFIGWSEAYVILNVVVHPRLELNKTFSWEDHLFYRRTPSSYRERLGQARSLAFAKGGQLGLSLFDENDVIAKVQLGLTQDAIGLESESIDHQKARDIYWFDLKGSNLWTDTGGEPLSLDLQFTVTTKAGTKQQDFHGHPIAALHDVPKFGAVVEYCGMTSQEWEPGCDWIELDSDGKIRIPELERKGHQFLGVRVPLHYDQGLGEAHASIEFPTSANVNTDSGSGSGPGRGEWTAEPLLASQYLRDGESLVGIFSVQKLRSALGNRSSRTAKISFGLDAGIVGAPDAARSVTTSITKDTLEFKLVRKGSWDDVPLPHQKILWTQAGVFEFGLDKRGVVGGVILLGLLNDSSLGAIQFLTKSDFVRWKADLAAGNHTVQVACFERERTIGSARGPAKSRLESNWPSGDSRLAKEQLDALVPILVGMTDAASARTEIPIYARERNVVQVIASLDQPERGYWSERAFRDLEFIARADEDSSPIKSLEMSLVPYGGNAIALERSPSSGVWKFSVADDQLLRDGRYTLKWRGIGECGNSFMSDEAVPVEFRIDNGGPKVSLLSPESSGSEQAVWKPEAETLRYVLRVRVEDANGLSTLTAPEGTIETESGQEIKMARLIANSSQPSTFALTTTLPSTLAHSKIRVKVKAYDVFETSTEEEWSFRLGDVQVPLKNRVDAGEGYDLILVRAPRESYRYCQEFDSRRTAGGLEGFEANSGHNQARSYLQARIEPLLIPKEKLRDFYLGAREVSNLEFQEFFRSNPLEFGSERMTELETYFASLSLNDGELPVEGVYWSEAQSFANSRGLRLPTGLEWEVAVRTAGLKPGETIRNYPGEGYKSDGGPRVYGVVGQSRPEPTTLAHAAFATPNGIQNLVGNVCEWTSTSYWEGADYKWCIEHAVGDLQAPDNARGMRYMVVGSWYDEMVLGSQEFAVPPHDYRRKTFLQPTPFDMRMNSGKLRVGFRCARDPKTTDEY